MAICPDKVKSLAVFTLENPLDCETADSFKEKIYELVESGYIYLVLDFKDVDFVDSMGLGTLLSSLKQVRKAGGDIRLCSLKERVRTLLDLTCLSNVFEICDSADEAQKKFSE